ncbi:MAG: Do family serine endopeptidase [bacterium]|nr:Do family serine endopeptidase [bacterium]
MIKILSIKKVFNASLVISAVCAVIIMSNIIQPRQSNAKDWGLPTNQAAIKYSFAPIVKQALPAVVNVYVRHRTRRNKRRSRLSRDPFFRRFFGDSFGVPKERIESSLGSGVIIDASGIVVTNYHVIEGATDNEIKIAMANRKEYRADIILKDKKTDLAVVKIRADGEKFPFLSIANSDDLEVGDLVLAMGNPFGVGQTVTSGIVSALARTGIGGGDAQYFIQTDAAINPGNSGGALVDMNGDLIGINTVIFSKSGGSLGIGFAIPSNMVSLVVNSARSGRSVQRPWFGANVKKVTPAISEGLDLPKPTGVYINSLGDESPARDAGLRVGDVILSVNSHAITDAKSFRYQFSIKGTGGRANLKIWRNGRNITKMVSLVSAPETPARNETRLRGNNPFSGALVANLSPALAEEISMSDQTGVVVVGLGRRSFAKRIGLVPKDILLQINGTEIESVADLVETLRGRQRSWRFTVKRGDNILSMSLGR